MAFASVVQKQWGSTGWRLGMDMVMPHGAAIMVFVITTHTVTGNTAFTLDVLDEAVKV